jgi:hypothetical protein
MRYYILLFLLAGFANSTVAQSTETDITGLWKGTLYNDTTGKFYQYEIGISEEKGRLSGFSHTWFILDDKQYYGVKKVKVKRVKGKIIVEDNGLISNNYPVSPAKGVRQLNMLDLQATDSMMSLTGLFTTNATKEYRPLTGTIILYRKNDFWRSALVPHLKELGLQDELSFVKAAARDEENIFQQQSVMARQEAEKQRLEEDRQANQIKAQQALVKKQAEEKERVIAELTAQQTAATQKAENDLAKQQAAELSAAKKMADAQAETAIALAKKRAEEEKIIKKQTAEKEKLARQLQQQHALEMQKTETALVKKQQQEEKLARQQEREIKDKQEADEKILAKQTAALAKPAAQQPNAMRPNILPAADAGTRETIVQQTVMFSSDSLQIALYDNGEVDGDTVSVIMNGAVIFSKQGLSTNAIKKTIYIPAALDTITLVMYAETLGSIPPNTGLLVVRDGKDLYEIRFSGDLQKNAAIVFRRKK